MQKNKKILYSIGAITSSLLLFLALGEHPYGYFTTLRWIICIVTIFGAHLFFINDRLYFVIPLGVIGILFNPIIPIHLNRTTWQVIDVVAGSVLLISVIFIWKHGKYNTAKKLEE